MNRGAALTVLLVHGLALAALTLERAQPSAEMAARSPLAVRLVAAPVSNQPLPAIAPPTLSRLPAPQLLPPLAFNEVAPTATTAVTSEPTGFSAALQPPSVSPSPVTSAPEQLVAEASRSVAAALAPDHGNCSARGVARHYPAMLRERGIEGQVLLRVQVDAEGHAAEAVVRTSSGWRLLDEAARQVALDCPYLPARRGDQRLAAWVEYPVRFALGGTAR